MIIVMNKSLPALTHILFHSCKVLSLYNGLADDKFAPLWITNEKVVKISAYKQCYQVLQLICATELRISGVLANCTWLKPNVKENVKFWLLLMEKDLCSVVVFLFHLWYCTGVEPITADHLIMA